MRLKPSDLEQLTDERLHSLGEAEAKRLLGIALSDLREALDRLNQGPGNSSRPSGSLAPFERGGSAGEGEAPDADDEAQPGADGSDRADGDEPEGTDVCRVAHRRHAAPQETAGSAGGNGGPQLAADPARDG